VVAEGFPAEELSDRLAADPAAVAWLDLHDPDEDDLQVVVREFGLHPLAVEDAVHDHQRPKLDRYASHLFLNVYAVAVDAAAATLTTSEVSAFVTPRALITVRKQQFDADALTARWDAAPELAGEGVGFLLHGLLDLVADGHHDAVAVLDDAVEDLEDQLFDPRPGADVRRRGFQLRKSLGQLRRVLLPTRELVARLLRVDAHTSQPLVTEALAPYFEDVQDHVLRAAEGVESARDLVTNVLDTNLNEQSYQLNEITKKLAAWAAIIAVPTAVTGWYGQNVPYPGFNQHWGFLTSAALIIALAGGLYVLLRRSGWL
jgi:magnesium transporter